MREKLEESWNKKYNEAGYAYGKAPNAYFRQELLKLTPGKILLPAEGEGRNAVFAAENGWDVQAFDLSKAGRRKALSLAAEKEVSIRYKVAEVKNVRYAAESFDAMALIFTHFQCEMRAEYHKKLSRFLKPGGILIVEGFSTRHRSFQQINPSAGGPSNLDMLYTTRMIYEEFPGFETLYLAEEVVELDEGKYHRGQSAVIRFTGKKN